MWDKARLTAYVAMVLGGIAAVLAYFGQAAYDAATNTVDLDPINLNVLAAWIVGAVGTPLLAAIALVKKWGRK